MAALLIVPLIIYLWGNAPTIHDISRASALESNTANRRSASGSLEQGTKSNVLLHDEQQPLHPVALSKQSLHPAPIYSRALVIARLAQDDVNWTKQHFVGDPQLSIVDYVVDDPEAVFSIPSNKGNEAMPYLSYIIDRYDRAIDDEHALPDISIFVHAHQYSWHNNDLLEGNAALMVARLSSEKVLRDGYFNMRCAHDPGCSVKLEPFRSSKDYDFVARPQEPFLIKAWQELFKGEEVPQALAQPCCSQFALSRERIRSIPLKRYVELRKWILDSDLESSITGRIFEYVWQYLWVGKHEHCLVEHLCYCEGFGVCFDGAQAYDGYFDMREEYYRVNDELTGIADESEANPDVDYRPKFDRLANEVRRLKKQLITMNEEALIRGEDPSIRALEADRVRERDGF